MTSTFFQSGLRAGLLFSNVGLVQPVSARTLLPVLAVCLGYVDLQSGCAFFKNYQNSKQIAWHRHLVFK